MNDDQLRERLLQLPASVEFPQDFSRSVWSRIESMESRGPVASRWKAFTDWISRPLPAFATIAIMLLAGSFAGVKRFRSDHSEKLQSAYLRSICPFGGELASENHSRP